MSYTILTSKRVFLSAADSDADGLSPATIIISKASGTIVSIIPAYNAPIPAEYKDNELHDVKDKVILPGLVDSHVHLNEPGRTSWEGFYTGTRAALSGGITTLIDMPLNSSPPTTTLANFKLKKDAAQGQCFCDVGFWGGVIPGNEGHLKELVEEGVKGFKCFLIDSGIDEFPCVTESDLTKAAKELEPLPTRLLFHAELSEDPSASSSCCTGAPTEYKTFLTSRPPDLELSAISLIAERLQPAFPNLQCHIVHLSASSALPLLTTNPHKEKLSVETCFHYLCLDAAAIPDGKPEFKCCPPIRDEDNRQKLWKGLEDGLIDMVVSDHSPCTEDLKYPANLDAGQDADYMTAWGGISTLGLGFSLLYTESLKRPNVSLKNLVAWTSVNTAAHAGLASRKGKIAEGYDGDFGVWDLEGSFDVTKESLNFKNKLSPYVGLSLRGVPLRTFVRGQQAFDREAGFGESALGAFV